MGFLKTEVNQYCSQKARIEEIMEREGCSQETVRSYEWIPRLHLAERLAKAYLCDELGKTSYMMRATCARARRTVEPMVDLNWEKTMADKREELEQELEQSLRERERRFAAKFAERVPS